MLLMSNSGFLGLFWPRLVLESIRLVKFKDDLRFALFGFYSLNAYILLS
jgi:hypothetical protein